MTKKLCTAVVSCIPVILALAFVEPPSVSAIQGEKRQAHGHAVSRRSRAARQRVRRTKNRRHATSYVCPMHPDVHSHSHGTCTKCLMELVAEGTK